jgi:hypothetical protein
VIERGACSDFDCSRWGYRGIFIDKSKFLSITDPGDETRIDNPFSIENSGTYRGLFLGWELVGVREGQGLKFQIPPLVETSMLPDDSPRYFKNIQGGTSDIRKARRRCLFSSGKLR